MLELDIRTVLIETILFALIFFVGIMRFAFNNRRFNGLRYYAYGNLLFFSGALFISLRYILPDWVSIVSANFLIALGFLLYTAGSYAYLRIHFNLLWLHVAALVLLLGGFVYFALFSPDVNVRIIIICLFLAAESAVSAVLFLKKAVEGQKKQKYSAAWGYLFFTAYCLFRIIWTLFESRIENFLHAGIVHALFFICVQFFMVVTSFSIYWISITIVNEDLETRAKLDPLTKVLNRRALLDELARELVRSRRESLTFSLVMIDIDNFKEINDTFGHLAGDSVLIGFTSLVLKNLRINDMMARYGGEEFILILPNTGKKQSAETAERIRRVIEENRHHFNGRDIKYTASFGVTSYDIDAQNKDELLENADMALYEAKSRGRNRVEVK